MSINQNVLTNCTKSLWHVQGSGVAWIVRSFPKVAINTECYISSSTI